MLMILARLVRSESFWAVVKVRSPHTGPGITWSTWSAVINLTPRTGELRSAPSWPDARHRVTGKRALAQGVRVRRAITRVSEG